MSQLSTGLTAEEKKIGGALPSPLPVTGTVPYAGKIFFGCGKEKAYRLARQKVIPTLDHGTRGKIALLHVLARKLGLDPGN
jgi:hypothetical protein